MFIPSGYIHAVFTPKTTIVIGGNFLHSFNIKMQIRVYEIESDLQVNQMFRYPGFVKIMWYAARMYLGMLRDRDNAELTHWEVEGLNCLLKFLHVQSNLMCDFDRCTKEERKNIRRSVPGVKNVKLLLKTLENKLESIMQGIEIQIDDDGWMSDMTEMEYCDSDVDHTEAVFVEMEESSEEEPLFSKKRKAVRKEGDRPLDIDDDFISNDEFISDEEIDADKFKGIERALLVPIRSMKNSSLVRRKEVSLSSQTGPKKALTVFQRLAKKFKHRR